MAGVIVIEDDRMRQIAHPLAQLKQLAKGAVWGEGPLYWPEDDSIIWSDAHGNCLLRWSEDHGVEMLRQPSHYLSGNARDHEGHLVSCSSGERAIVRRERSGQWAILVDHYQGKRLNSPNDLAIKSDDTVWFTDPSYGLTQPNQGYGGEQEQPGCFVYCFEPDTGEIEAVVTDMVRPNGLAFSPDEQRLYIADSGAFNILGAPHHIRVYEVTPDRHVSNGQVFAVIEPGQPDGLCVDCQGHVFVSAADGIHVYAPSGTRLGKILVPEVCSNLTFGGQEGDRLFITAGHSLYAINLTTRGADSVTSCL